ncbi:hypothetical protein [Clostridium cellulovorans]|uniref:Uncharacterized protein n=1 Tax=Clostridium cellulovorans (strain ATCC 35296 / DSM 3052 / OCM 3 / 743B) TaxID=573061 RepID=D9SXE0_CLOC7|nr:hypothetical protein [Clostridium cellulovorans]ADL53443.1 hypothetical protein Clocel_3773 [Clostridium cellulovorans 743B]
MGSYKTDDIEGLLYKANEEIIVSNDYTNKLIDKIENSKSIIDITLEFIFAQRLSLSFICSGFLLLIIGIFGLESDMINKISNFKIMLP